MAGHPVIPKGSPPPLAPYSPGFQAGRTVHTSGMLSMDKDGNIVGSGDAGAQTRQVMENIKGVLEAAGGSMEDVVFNLIFLSDFANYQAMNTVYGEYFPNNPPARACVQSGLVKPEFLVEIAATADIGK